MADIAFAWTAAKAAANKRKHRVSFIKAQTVFYNEEALLLDDPDHSEYGETDEKGLRLLKSTQEPLR